jgi:hypothetical protein
MGLVNGQPLDKVLMNAAVGAAMSSDVDPSKAPTVTQDPEGLDEFLSSLDQYKVKSPALTAKDVTNPLGPLEEFNPEETDWASFYKNVGGEGVDESNLSKLSPEERARYDALKGGDTSSIDDLMKLPGQEMQITPDNWTSFNNNLIDIVNNKGGFTSQWQTSGSDRIMINDDGTGIGINTETGESYALDEDQVNKMIENGQLNTKESGYVDATGGTGNTPGGSGETSPSTPAKVAPVKAATAPIANAITKAVLPVAGAAAGAKLAPTGTASTALPGMSGAGQQTSNADLLNLLGSKPELANIKSFKELFGEGLFGDSYVPPSAGGAQADAEPQTNSSTASQGEGEEQLFTGGRVDDFDVDALLRILRS